MQGVGLVHVGDGPTRLLRPGESVTVPPRTRHWHGSAPGRLFVHLAIQEAADDGTTATWYEHVGEAEYRSAAGVAED
jgi:4-carboxymuconolactone decarboxylase